MKIKIDDGGIWTWGSCAMSRVPFLNKFFPGSLFYLTILE
jgi:hypothetical protein